MSTGDVKRKLTAIFSADVEGYSRLMGEDELATIETLTSHKEIMGKLIRQYRGRVVDSTGDNLLAEFASVVDAVQCAVEVQQILSSKNETLPENRRMYFRIGINLGDVVEEGERIYGDGVNVAARVESLAEGGGISISGTAYDQLGKKLPLGYKYLGEQSVKNIEKPVRVYRILTEAEAAGKVIGEIRPKAKQLRWAAVGALAVLIIGVGALAIWNFYLRPAFEPASVEKMAFPLPDEPSIAVLPFTNMSDDPEQEYFTDGITEQIITGLSKTPKLFVIARNSTFTYKGKAVKVQQVAQELGVRYVLEGSIQKSGERIRISAQLIDALTGRHLWSERYDRGLKDIFAVQDQITITIMTALRVKLTEGELARPLEKGTDNLEVYTKYLQAREHLRRRTKDDNAAARRIVKEAIALDPEYAPLYTLLALAHMIDILIRSSENPKQSLAQAIKLTQKSIYMDESLHHSHAVLGLLYTLARQHDKGISECERAVALNPNAADAHFHLGNALRFAGRHEEAVRAIEKAVRLNPFPRPLVLSSLGAAYFFTGRYEKAIEIGKKAVREAPDDLIAHLNLASAYVGAGREKEAQSQIEEVLRIDPKYSLEYLKKMLPHKNSSDKERAIGALRKAGLPENPPLPLPDKPSIAVLPFTNLSDDPKQEYFVDGMTDDLITDLSKISGLFVIARNSVFGYKGKPVDLKKLSRELGVRHVLEGSVRKVGDQVRINAQLIDATTGGHLWSERYDGKMDDVFALQDQITGKIVTALKVELGADEKEQVTKKETYNIAAYDAFLKGWGHYFRHTPEDFGKALPYFEKANELDPNYGRAHAALARTYWTGSQLGFHKGMDVSWAEARMRAREYLEMAMKNPTSIAHTVASEMNLSRRLHEKAIIEAEVAIALDPNEADNHTMMAKALIFAGRQEEAFDFIENAMRLDPHNIGYPLYLRGLAFLAMRQLDESVASIERALTHNPEAHGWAAPLAVAYARLGRDQKARAALSIYEKTFLQGRFILYLVMYRWPFKDQEIAERFADGLLKAGLPGQSYYKVSEENKLGREEIRDLFFGKTVTSFYRDPWHKEHLEHRTKVGKATWRAAPGDYYGQDDSGTSWVKGDSLCNQWQINMFGIKHCVRVFRNPEGTHEMKNKYLGITDFGFITFSQVD